MLFLLLAAAAALELPPGLPAGCRPFATCPDNQLWAPFTAALTELLPRTTGDAEAAAYYELLRAFGRDAGMALDCRMGLGAVCYRLAQYHVGRGQLQKAHNLHQLAMAMLWDTTRQAGGMDCLAHELFGCNWDRFMDDYLTLAFQLRRHEDDGLPPLNPVPRDYRNRELRIAIASTCAYDPGHKLHGIDVISLENREAYTSLHGYSNEFFTEVDDPSRHPVWSAVSTPLRLLRSGKYDWVAWLDCDAMTVDMGITMEHLIYSVAGEGERLRDDVFLLISEDGRGLAGGNWIVRNSPEGEQLLASVLGTNDTVTHPYNRHDLRDQFSFLWHLVRPLADTAEPQGPPGTWESLEYLPGVRLIPQRLFNAYPWASCRPSHHCFEDESDFIVSFIQLGAQSRDMAFAMLRKFHQQSMRSHADLLSRRR